MKVSTVREMRQLDRRAMDEFLIPGHILMENAGQATYFVILEELGVLGKRFVVVCGPGNNGGDGLVVARKLHSTGGDVRVFILGDVEEYDDVSQMNFKMLSHSGVEITVRPSIEVIEGAIAQCDVVVDALLGTGIKRDVNGSYRAVIERINLSKKMVFSVDIPSGVDGDTGQIRGNAVRADYTITFGLPKQGNLLYPGAECGGRLWVSHISFPPALQNAGAIKVSLSTPAPLPKRKVDGHKGTFGDVLFIAGASSYFGAPAFAALSLLKAGGGYARLAAPRSLTPFLAGIGSEIVFVPQEETQCGSLSLSNAERLLELSENADFVVLGPGLSLAEETQELVRRLTPLIKKPLLIDGDGLTAIAKDIDLVKRRSGSTILTPHPGEMSRLSGMRIPEIAADAIGLLQRMAGELRTTIVLKGAHSLIALAHEHVFINTSGNSGMASAGSGDVLTGTIAAMYGLGLPIEEAAKTGVFMHGFAGDLAARDKGADGITARDILEYLPAALKAYRENYEEVTRDFYGTLKVV